MEGVGASIAVGAETAETNSMRRSECRSKEHDSVHCDPGSHCVCYNSRYGEGAVSGNNQYWKSGKCFY